jgi:hypothetical protein
MVCLSVTFCWKSYEKICEVQSQRIKFTDFKWNVIHIFTCVWELKLLHCLLKERLDEGNSSLFTTVGLSWTRLSACRTYRHREGSVINVRNTELLDGVEDNGTSSTCLGSGLWKATVPERGEWMASKTLHPTSAVSFFLHTAVLWISICKLLA